MLYDKIESRKEYHMKKPILTLMLVILLTLCLASPAFAGGDKVRGDNGQGAVNQVQVQDPPPFQP
jgi:hypothetical protein